jgi:hypothetical protein
MHCDVTMAIITIVIVAMVINESINGELEGAGVSEPFQHDRKA